MKQIIFILQCLHKFDWIWQQVFRYIKKLGKFKRDEVPTDNADLAVDNNCVFNSKSFKNKKTLVG